MPTPKTYSFAFPASLTGSAIVDSLISGKFWLGSGWNPSGATNLSYSFMAPVTSYFVTDYSPKNEYNALYELTTAQKTAITGALGAWSAVANLNFTLTSDTLTNVGDLRFGGYRLMDDKTAAWAYFPENLPAGGDVWVGEATNDPNPVKGSYDFMTFVHEIGHALGLKHPFDTSATNNTLLDPSLDDVHFTVMSYNSNYSYQPTTPMVLDILAIQSLYGANMAWQTGDNVYKWAANQSIFETIWDAGGNDTIDGSNQLAAVSINLNEGAYSQIGKAFVDLNNMTAINDGLAIAYGAKIENATGSAFDDVLTGNTLNNTLNGGLGADTMIGGSGNDSYYVDNLGDVVVETGTSLTEIDRVFASIDYTLGSNVENVLLIGSALNATGNELNNRMTGNDGNNTLDGKAGADTMLGGLGNDTYIVDNAGDTIIETSTLAGEIDTVRSSVNWTLGDNLENLVLTGSSNLNGIGNALNNTLSGNDGNNLLNGGAGADTMLGGLGDDTYIVDNVGDTVTELVGEGHDLVRSSISYTLSANIEDGTLVGSGVLDLTGNALDNVLTGTDGVNTLNGGLGADTMIGGAGNDSYYVDNLGDVVVETGTSLTEIDRVFASIDYTLGSNVENVLLIGSALNATGNELNNRMTGNDGNNTLDGKAGADTMLGGLGNDTYIVDNAGDTIIETSTLAGEIDTVRSSVNWTLGDNLENLVLTGSSNLNGIGNALNNTLSGNDGNNLLNGGAGADTMLGGLGDDTYIVDNVGDTVTELVGEGHDLVRSSISYTLSANIEDGTLVGSGVLDLTGNALDNVLTGTDGVNTLNGGLGADTMIGGAGNDSYYVDNLGDVVVETGTSLTEIDRVFASIDYTLGSNVENVLLIGSALNATGNELNNRMTGNDGNNTLDGKAGADTMLGGLGNDTYIVDNAGDTVTELVGEGHDLVRSSISYTLSANIEDGTLVGSGVLDLTGNALDNVLTGTDGVNTLNGGLGADTMIGGAGNDSYYVDNLGDVVVETGTSLTEIDRVFASIDYTLGSNVENVLLIGSALNATGNELNNRMTGNDGNNTLDGKAGADTMLGGLGNDTYIVDNAGDTIIETSTLAGEIDTVRSSVNWTLGDNLENLVLTGSSNLNGIGNALNNTLSGNDGNNLLNGGAGADTMLGGLGDDTYIVDNLGDTVTELVGEGHDLVRSSISYTLSANIEDGTLVGSGVLDLTGNALDNVLTGTDGVNTLNGGLGADTMIGGAGNDSYYVDNLGDVVVETGTSLTEIDRVFASIDYTLGSNVENVLLIGSALNATGNELNNRMTGNDGNNTLDGKAGADTMLGGLGNDTYIVDNAGDTIIETSTLAGEIDTVRSSVNWTLGDNLENLVLTGSSNLNGIGNALNNTLSGNDGNNLLNGGAGADTMLGGLGDDTYIVDNVGDTVTELVGEGHDLVRSSISYTLSANIEDGTLVGSGVLDLTGNALDNVLTGTDGVNTLNGGLGADTMIGGAGNDSYYVDNLGDVVVETGTSLTEIDRVFASIDYTLGSNVENVLLIGSALNATGNELNNRMTGNDGNNTLDGKAGADTMLGGLGNDTYIVDNAGDTIIETSTLAGEIDTVRSSVNWTLGDNLENLVLTGSSNLNGIGNALNNTLSGNDGNNLLNGGAGADTLIGGQGTDTLTGGSGADTFVFNAWSETGIGNLRDVISDFNSAQGDKIDLTKFDANLLSDGFNGFSFIGAADFTGAGQLRFIDHVLSGNVSGNAGADFEIQLVGVNSFSANDLVA
ncbi:calcium-binding protein [Pseudomonas zeae]|uniref:M10 family metallopeptidase n=1 Tax=Pseudomonas zeae TaxID=2745510 RepID=UPI002147E86E|nr:M10 family metallopeptidase [Pseudomonas zeae]UUT11804.1 calcium-binding protein [Pseudomonas zeae]